MDISIPLRANSERGSQEMSDEKKQVRWIEDPDTVGEMLFTFDGKQIFNLFRDYPQELSAEQKNIFDQENPYWADFFKDRYNQ